MNNGMWDLTKNKTKKNESSNITTNLYKIFIIMSILICIFLFPSINSISAKFSDVYSVDEGSFGIVPSKIENQITIYILSILIVYLVMLVMLVVRKNNHRKVYYPLSLFTLTIIFINLGIVYLGYFIITFLIILFLPIIILIVTLSIIGNKLDNNTITRKTVVIILGSILLLISIIPILTLVSSTGSKVNEPIHNNEKIDEQQDINYEIAVNKTKEEFNNLLDNNLISINNLKLSKDYNTIDIIELLIITDNVPDNEMNFCNKLIDSYNDIKGLLNKYNYTSQTIHFKFTNNNPFAEKDSTYYKNSGYIRVGGYIDSDKTWYHVYLNPTPIEIN